MISTITEVDKTQNFPCDNYVFRNTGTRSCNIYTYDIILLLKLVARRDDELLVLSVRLRWQKCSEDTTDLQSLLLVLLDQKGLVGIYGADLCRSIKPATSGEE